MMTAYKIRTDFTLGRSDWADTLKAIVIFFVCINHHFAQDRENYRAIWLYLSSFDVPLFFFLGGLFFKEGATRLPLSGIFVKKFKTRIIPYFAFGAFTYMVWLALYVLHQTGIYQSRITEVHPIKPSIGMFYGNATNDWLIQNAALWFLPCSFVV
ncbi:MAG TPA: acyltransferase family protein, partial [Syntrophorhabdaceae bacterium]|nr:acyltransferase family protein [Syntrophorhabdaceae bacterium]